MWAFSRSSPNVTASFGHFLRGRPLFHGHHLPRRFASTFPKQGSFTPFFSRAKVPYRSFGRRYLWILPVSGGLTLYCLPRQPTLLSSLFASPKIIPLPHSKPEAEQEEIISLNSPNEENRSLLSRIRRFFVVWIWEPILTTRRFVHLFVIFVPVILTSPALLFGEVQGKKGSNSGAIWWYDFLVGSLQRAGPTFIKASTCYLAPQQACF